MTIAGSDSCAGAGVQADIKTMSSLGLYAACCITAVTAQNTMGVRAVEAVSPNMLSAQIEAVLSDLDISAIKIGMIYTKENVLAIKRSLISCGYKGSIVLDPVLVATSGDALAKEDFLSVFKAELLPMADLITPNLQEAETLSAMTLCNVEQMEQAARKIQSEYRVKNILIKGGHLQDGEMTDLLLTSEGKVQLFSSPKIHSENTHGTGCTLSSALCSFIALGNPLTEAVGKAKDYISKAILSSASLYLGHGHGAVNHLHSPQKLITF